MIEKKRNINTTANINYQGLGWITIGCIPLNLKWVCLHKETAISLWSNDMKNKQKIILNKTRLSSCMASYSNHICLYFHLPDRNKQFSISESKLKLYTLGHKQSYQTIKDSIITKYTHSYGTILDKPSMNQCKRIIHVSPIRKRNNKTKERDRITSIKSFYKPCSCIAAQSHTWRTPQCSTLLINFY